jgi:hypothetical protein
VLRRDRRSNSAAALAGPVVTEELRGQPVKRTTAIAIGTLGVLTLVLAGATTAGANTLAKLHFGTDSVTLTVPNPPCRPTHGTTSCQWTLAVIEGRHGPVEGLATGTSGVVRVTYPAAYCGVIHAAGLVGPPWRREIGFQHTVATCSTPVTAPPDAVTGQVPAIISSQVLAVATGQPPALQGKSGPPDPPAFNRAELAFTGAPILDILVAGIACLALAAWCLRKRPASWNRLPPHLL